MIITPVILAGGNGTRLWPLSRKSYPKQFSNLIGNKTLFQQSALRSTSSSKLKFSPHITITNNDFRFIVSEQLEAIGLKQGQILIEPEIKNTAPAILAASIYAYNKNPDAVLLVTPSDHVISDTKEFHSTINKGLSQINNKKIVIFGATPTYPETGYGYIELDKQKINESVSEVISFVEKPKMSDAKKMINSGNYLWNAGIFMFKASDIIAAFKTFQPNTLQITKSAVEKASFDLGFLRLDNVSWKKLENVSIDHAIIEKVNNLVVVPFLTNWSDLGSWNSIWSESEKDKLGMVLSEGAHAIDCKDSLLRSEKGDQQLVGLGLDNIVAIAMSDAVLVANKKRTQDVKKVIDYLKEKNIKQSEIFRKDHRPWGWFESLIESEFFQVKLLFINPISSLSLQSHRYRSEHWIVVKGEAKITIEDNVQLLNIGQSVYVAAGLKHRIENCSNLPVMIVEVQTGTYLGEDDIVRYEDIYSRK